MFFDRHDRLLGTSNTAVNANRLNLRHVAMIERHADLLAGASVLDIASHDGRWTLAALEAGAAHVTGVEARPELVAHAHENVEHYLPGCQRHRFVNDDLFEYLREPDQVDVVMCLGFIYHTLRYPDLLQGIRATGARHVIVDTRVTTRDKAVIDLEIDHPERQGHAVPDASSPEDAVLTGVPSHIALAQMFEAYGYDVAHRVDWHDVVGTGSREGVGAYLGGRRITWLLERRTSV